MSQTEIVKPEGRVARRQRKNRMALIAAGRRIMSEKGFDAATMLEIADAADVGAGTVYNYFKSKEELAIAVLEELMHELALKIEEVTNQFEDPAEVYAFGIRTVIEHAITDVRWRQLLYRSEVISNTMFRVMGPFAIRDLERATEAERFKVEDATLCWRLATHVLVGAALAITTDEMGCENVDEVVISLLCMNGIGRDEARILAFRNADAHVD